MSEFKTEWDLSKHFFTSINDPRIDEILANSEKEVEDFVSKWEGNIYNATPEKLLNFYKEKDILKDLTTVYYYLGYLSTLDTQDQEVLNKLSSISTLMSEFSQELLFIDEEFKKMGYDKLYEYSNLPELKEYKKPLQDTADNLKYILKPNQEKVLIEVSNVVRIFDDIYNELTNSFEYKFKDQLLTSSEIYAKKSSSDPEERKEAFNSIFTKYEEKSNQIVLGNLYKSVCKANVCDIKNRKYDGIMSTRNISEDMDDSVVNKLLDTVKSKYHLYHQFLKKKATLIGKDKLDYWDIFAPITGKEFKMDFNTGLNFYLDKIKEFDTDFYNYSKEIFEDGRVSVYPKKGKRDGAYASYNKDHKSFVMLNYVDNFDSIMTLTHELGHAIHGWLSQVQNSDNFESSLSLAETASIFNETLIFESILDSVEADEKSFYIVSKLDDIFSTIYRQVQYVLFERECHQRFLDGEELGYEDFNDIWLNGVKELYGDSVNMTEDMRYGWSSIPHIFSTPFYCYTYSFGNILSFSLYQMYKNAEDKSEFVKMYKNILKSGGSVKPKELLLRYGIDIESEEFYNTSFELIEELINKL